VNLVERRHRRIDRALCFAAAALTVAIVAGLLGQWIRDRSVLSAILMYLPLLPVGVAAVVLDLGLGGRALRRPRFALTVVGTVAISAAAIPMVGSGVPSQSRASESEITILHWNVQWGGGLFRSQQTWAAQRSEILSRDPDIVILSEAPRQGWVKQLVSDLGTGADCVGIQHDPGSRYWFGLVVCSRWPLRLEERHAFPAGVGMSVTAEVRGRPIRILAVDGQSNPFRSRLPFLQAISEACRAAAEDGRPFDIVAGDFNTPSRSLGFDDLVGQGYQFASQAARGWRATFPAWLPVYDIDHVLVGHGRRASWCTLFNGPATDHRGQVARLSAGPAL
jgi:endonuclease/exonuclease/phosphatase family metal-dependent hydrolase